MSLQRHNTTGSQEEDDDLVLRAVIAGVNAAAWYHAATEQWYLDTMLPMLLKEPCRTSPLSGEEYTRELLEGNHHRIKEQLRMPITVFRELVWIVRQRGLLTDSDVV